MSTTQLRAAMQGGQAQGAAGRPMTKYDVFKGKLEGARHDLRAYLGSVQAVDRFIGLCVSAVVERPELLNADMASLLSSCKRAANDGLMPDGREAVLNIYRTKVKTNGREEWIEKVQYLPMAAGIIKLIYEAGATYVDAAAVYERDAFRFIRGDETRLTHEPYPGDDPGEIIAAYAVVKLESGEIKREVMFARDIAKVRAASKSADRGPWVTWPDQMAIKAVLKRIRKQLPVESRRLESVIDHDNEDFVGVVQTGTVAHVAQGALTHDPSPTLDQELPAERETVERGDPAPEVAHQSIAVTFAEVEKAMTGAKTVDALDAAADLIGDVADTRQREELNALYRDLRGKLEG